MSERSAQVLLDAENRALDEQTASQLMAVVPHPHMMKE